jgi:hypothetical protein
LRVLVEVGGDKDVERKLRDMAVRSRHTRTVFLRMLDDLREAQREWFDAHGAGFWAPMDPDTKRRWGEHPLLELFGTLMRSLVETQAPYAVREASDGEARFGTWDPVAHLQAGGHGAPKRAVLAPLTRSRTRLAEKLRKHILESE